MYYLKFTVLSIAYFLAMHLIIHLVAMRKTHIYREMNTQKRSEYRCYIVSPLHAILAVFLSTIAMFYICGDGKTVFNNDECMSTVRYIHVWALLHTCGYFIVDFFFIYFVVGGNTPLDYQTYAHHIFAVTTYYQTLYFMDFMCVFGCLLLFIEISNPFTCMRWLLFTHGMHETKWYAINAICMFLTFLFGRVIYQFYVCIWFGADWVYAEYEQSNMTVYKGVVVAELAIMVIMSMALNSYWMWLMLKMIWRVIKRAMEPKADPIEKVELVKADGLAIDNEVDDGNST